jgi:hypothetical protein
MFEAKNVSADQALNLSGDPITTLFRHRQPARNPRFPNESSVFFADLMITPSIRSVYWPPLLRRRVVCAWPMSSRFSRAVIHELRHWPSD